MSDTEIPRRTPSALAAAAEAQRQIAISRETNLPPPKWTPEAGAAKVASATPIPPVNKGYWNSTSN
jgi:hypothetical protein